MRKSENPLEVRWEDEQTGEVRHHLRGLLVLNLVTFLWGTTFTVVKIAEAHLNPAVIVFLRFGIAALCFLPYLPRLIQPRQLWVGLELGFWLWIGYATQAIGLKTTTPSQSAFITALNVILVPLFLGLVGRKIPRIIWISALLAVLGVGLLSYDGSQPTIGDLWTLGCAASYALYIVRLEALAPRFPSLELAAAQVFGVLPFALGWSLLSGPLPNWHSVPWLALVYLGVLATALTTWLQTLGQGHVAATEAAIIYTLEPVWATLFAFVFLGQSLGWQGLLGASLVVVATLVSQLPGPRSRVEES